MHYITVLRQQSARGGIMQPQRPNYLCWFPINPLSCFGSAVRPGATCDIPRRYATAQRFYVSLCEILCERREPLPFRLPSRRVNSLFFVLYPRSRRVPFGFSAPVQPLAYVMDSPRLTICKTALMVLTDGKAVNNRLCDKPLNWWGEPEKKGSGPRRVMRFMAIQAVDIMFVYMLPESQWKRRGWMIVWILQLSL